MSDANSFRSESFRYRSIVENESATRAPGSMSEFIVRSYTPSTLLDLPEQSPTGFRHFGSKGGRTPSRRHLCTRETYAIHKAYA